MSVSATCWQRKNMVKISCGTRTVPGVIQLIACAIQILFPGYAMANPLLNAQDNGTCGNGFRCAPTALYEVDCLSTLLIGRCSYAIRSTVFIGFVIAVIALLSFIITCILLKKGARSQEPILNSLSSILPCRCLERSQRDHDSYKIEQWPIDEETLEV